MQPAPDARPHKTGLLRRLNVYRLNNSYQDCYHEAEFQAAALHPIQSWQKPTA